MTMFAHTGDDTFQGEVFEGPEKKLEVFFRSSASDAEGFRQFGQETWSELLVAVSCSILHSKANDKFDAYLLSESSMFVYADKVILKTCGTTTLLLFVPKLLALAETIGARVWNVHYGRYRYKFPEQQLYPHTCFDQECAYLSQYFSEVHSRIVGPADGRCWFVLCARPENQAEQQTNHGQKQLLLQEPMAPHDSPAEGEDIFEIAMEGLAPDVCSCFFESAFPHLSGRALAAHMTNVSGIGALLPNVDIDDWAFEPCGYSMNGLRDGFYYTIHITPEEGFSYASFETNDPKYRQPEWVQTVISTFKPTVCTATLTTRRVVPELLTYKLAGYERTCMEAADLGAGVSVCSMNFNADQAASRKRTKLAMSVAAKPADYITSSEALEPRVNVEVRGAMLAVA